MTPLDSLSPITTMIFLSLMPARQGVDNWSAMRSSRASFSIRSDSSGWPNLKPSASAGPVASETSATSIANARLNRTEAWIKGIRSHGAKNALERWKVSPMRPGNPWNIRHFRAGHGRCNLWGTGLGRPLNECAVRIAPGVRTLTSLQGSLGGTSRRLHGLLRRLVGGHGLGGPVGRARNSLGRGSRLAAHRSLRRRRRRLTQSALRLEQGVDRFRQFVDPLA